MKCVVSAYLPAEREAQDSMIYLVGGVAERLTVTFHLFIEAPTQEALC